MVDCWKVVTEEGVAFSQAIVSLPVWVYSAALQEWTDEFWNFLQFYKIAKKILTSFKKDVVI